MESKRGAKSLPTLAVQRIASDVVTTAADLLVVGVFVDEVTQHPTVRELDKQLQGVLKSAMGEQEFVGRSGQRLVVHTLGSCRAKRVALVGMGARDEAGPTAWLGLGGVANRLANRVGASTMILDGRAAYGPVKRGSGTRRSRKAAASYGTGIDGGSAAITEALMRGMLLGGYRFDVYRSEPKRASALAKVRLWMPETLGTAEAKAALARGQALAGGASLARDLVNMHAGDLNPATFATRAQAVARAGGLKAKVLKPDQLKRQGMNLILAVGAGSTHTPRLVHLTYTPSARGRGRGSKAGPKKSIVLVGKGITFDSGGLCLKSPANMMDMKMDMGGAAAVLGAMQVVGALKPDVTVHGVLALAENMPSGTACRLGDVIQSAAGKSVEINNTDAEGRLVLADALHYATQLKPDLIIDLATLTGACVVALGPHTVGMFTNGNGLGDHILAASKQAGEDFWHMPLNEALREQLKSDIADMKNTGERYGGAITAALFLRSFVGDVPWAHLDIAGPATAKKDSGHICKGGTGVAVATLEGVVGQLAAGML